LADIGNAAARLTEGVVVGSPVRAFTRYESSRFVCIAHRFESAEAGFSRVALAAGCAEARGPCDAVTGVPTPTVWAHSTVVTLLAGAATDTIAFEQEVIEILAMDGEAVLAEAAAVIRVPGVGVCLGPFHGAE
jgi:hypothetical protein